MYCSYTSTASCGQPWREDDEETGRGRTVDDGVVVLPGAGGGRDAVCGAGAGDGGVCVGVVDFVDFWASVVLVLVVVVGPEPATAVLVDWAVVVAAAALRFGAMGVSGVDYCLFDLA